MAYCCGMDLVNGIKDLESRSRKEDVSRNALRRLEGLHLPCLLQNVCAHMNLKDAARHSTQAHSDTLLTEESVTFHLDHPDNKDLVNQTAGML